MLKEICVRFDEFYSLGFMVSRAAIALAKAVNAAFVEAGIDLPHSQFTVLRCLYYKDGISQLDIANTIFKDAAAVKRTVDNLEEKGLVVRSQVRTLKNAVYITEEGRNLMPKVLEVANGVIEKALTGMDKPSRDSLMLMLDDIYNNLSK